MKHKFENPENYSQNSDTQYAFACQLINDFDLNKYRSILDIGCGDGRITSYMSKLVPETTIVGSDLSSSMISYANKKHATNTNNLTFVEMNAESNLFHNEFELIVSFCCLHWVKNQLNVLNGIEQALKPQGKMLLFIPLKHYELYAAIESVTATEKWRSFFHRFINPHQFFSIESYNELIEQSPINKANMSEQIMDYFFDSKLSMENWLAAWLPHIKQLPENLKKDFMNDIGCAFLKLIPLTKENKVRVPLRMLTIKT